MFNELEELNEVLCASLDVLIRNKKKLVKHLINMLKKNVLARLANLEGYLINVN